MVQPVLEGNIREIVGKMKLEEMVSDRQKFGEQVKENAEPDLAKMGLDIVSFNVQNFSDKSGVIENLGVDNIVKIKKSAAISRAQSEKDIAKAQAEAEREANEAKVDADTQIAIRQNELEIKKAELKKQRDIEKAKADASYTIEEEEQRKIIEAATADANIVKQSKEIELQKRHIEQTEYVLDAEIRKQAEAKKYAKMQEADAELYERQQNAEAEKFENMKASEAEKFEAEQVAEALRAKANAEAEATKIKGEAEAEAIRARGNAEAESIQAKALAEAEGIKKKAEAMKLMGEASVLEMYFNMLPEAIKNSAEAYNNVDKIYMYGSDNSAKLTEDMMTRITQISEGLEQSTGIDLKSLISAFVGGKLGSNDGATE